MNPPVERFKLFYIRSALSNIHFEFVQPVVEPRFWKLPLGAAVPVTEPVAKCLINIKTLRSDMVMPRHIVKLNTTNHFAAICANIGVLWKCEPTMETRL